MRCAWIALAFLSCAALPAWAVNKCTARNGTVTFQDAPCPTTAQSTEELRVREQGTISSAGSYGIAPLDVTGPATERFARAAAAIENLADLSTDCKMKLQTFGTARPALDACQRFTTHHSVWWKPATGAVAELRQDRAWAAANDAALQQTARHVAKVNENMEFISLRMKAAR